jgi:hypothetical protein
MSYFDFLSCLSRVCVLVYRSKLTPVLKTNRNAVLFFLLVAINYTSTLYTYEVLKRSLILSIYYVDC